MEITSREYLNFCENTLKVAYKDQKKKGLKKASLMNIPLFLDIYYESDYKLKEKFKSFGDWIGQFLLGKKRRLRLENAGFLTNQTGKKREIAWDLDKPFDFPQFSDNLLCRCYSTYGTKSKICNMANITNEMHLNYCKTIVNTHYI